MTILSLKKLGSMGIKAWAWAVLSGYGNKMMLNDGTLTTNYWFSSNAGVNIANATPLVKLAQPAISDSGGVLMAKRSDTATASLYLSTDGINWATIAGAGSRTWLSVFVSGDGKVRGGTINGQIVISSDSGGTWTVLSSPSTLSHQIAISYTGVLIFSIANNVWKSTDFGVTWTLIYTNINFGGGDRASISSDAITILLLAVDGTGWANRALSTNGGSTWNEAYINTYFIGPIKLANNGFVIGISGGGVGSIVISEDYGISFSTILDNIYNIGSVSFPFLGCTLSKSGDYGIFYLANNYLIGFNIITLLDTPNNGNINHYDFISANRQLSGLSINGEPPALTSQIAAITYYMKGIDSAGNNVYWSSASSIDLNPLVTIPSAVGSIVYKTVIGSESH